MRNLRVMIFCTVLAIAAFGQIVLAFLLYTPYRNAVIINTGWGILFLSAVFGWLPIYTFKKWGKVPEGKGYVHTTTVVDRGMYAIVRHPQYLAGILMSAALCLITTHWAVILTGIVAAVTEYISMIGEEKAVIEKFGQAYEEYMQRVPRTNFILGIIRLSNRRRLVEKHD